MPTCRYTTLCDGTIRYCNNLPQYLLENMFSHGYAMTDVSATARLFLVLLTAQICTPLGQLADNHA
jgi:hypothetical protein